MLDQAGTSFHSFTTIFFKTGQVTSNFTTILSDVEITLSVPSTTLTSITLSQVARLVIL
jgi:hypothetical protein